jgi:hypothetical protein
MGARLMFRLNSFPILKWFDGEKRLVWRPQSTDIKPQTDWLWTRRWTIFCRATGRSWYYLSI